ncbi:MAG: polysaccharide biosynthesis C-terminal domain-containing protein [Bacteroidales bacterium]|nr:polysaccharide biosynthesis C-terminal domain-containing protein [Bacteroidales bacterium]
MASLKQLAGQTVIYGLSSIVGRLLNYLLVPLYTYKLATEAYGTVTEMYSYVAFLVVILMYGMETAFFRYNETETDKIKVYSTTLLSILATSAGFLLLVGFFAQDIANILLYPQHKEYILWFGLIIAFDAISAIPLALLRAQNKARRFVIVRLLFIGVNLGLNIFFIVLCPYFHENQMFASFTSLVYDGEISIKYIFISNLLASAIQLLILTPEFMKVTRRFDIVLWKKMMIYALPLLVFGLAGIVNETLDRILIKYLMPQDIAMSQLGIYGAVYKISILMTIFIQAFRYAAEPFFFAQAAQNDAKKQYAEVMNWFVIACSLIFLGTMLYLQDVIIFFIGPGFREGMPVISVLLLANLFLGIYYNLSIWYKLTNKTIWGAYISIFGAMVTIILNILWIPVFGYVGSAWATLICYFSMMLVSYLIGQKYYPVHYDLKRITGYIALAIILVSISAFVSIESLVFRLIFNTILLLAFISIVLSIEKNKIKLLLKKG